ncbi:MAG: GNAT family N-acetyltransferase [Actinobacteria bacterium HGW-Actinobacteria-2]|nr:MAG: GNAT family N-acetyltransferase [Actinobacteria bacterium HGW-Actinobacteria-2]
MAPITPNPTPPNGFSDVEVTEELAANFLALDTWAFPMSQGVPELLTWASPLDWSRARALRAADRDGLAAIHASYAFSRFPVPGATLAAAGLTWVGVHPEFRRRGLLTSMIGTHFADCQARNEAISVLTASEPAIYGRFGYGLASRTVALTLPRGAALRPVPGSERVSVSFEVFDAAKHLALVSELHEHCGAIAPGRPGWATRETPQLQQFFVDDPESVRDGFESLRILLAHTEHGPSGYALFRRKLDWDAGQPSGLVAVSEVVAGDPATLHALWSRLLDFDLTHAVTIRLVQLDDPLLSLLVDLRATKPRVSDNLWVRLIDVPAALAARRYAAPVDLTIAVSDELLADNAGIWRVQAEPFSDNVSVTRADDAQISLDVRELGSLYLGGSSASALAQAGLLTGSAEDVQQLSAAFGWPLQPGVSWIF